MTTQSTLPAGQAVQTTLRPMRPEDLASCHAMSLHLYWPHRLADWQFHHQVSSSWAVELEEPDGTRSVAGSGMLCPLGDDYASLGLVIITDALQGRGLGRAMMQRLLQDAGTRNVILNATEAGRPLYEKLGFVVTDTLSQHQSTTARATPVLAAGARIRPLRKDEVPICWHWTARPAAWTAAPCWCRCWTPLKWPCWNRRARSRASPICASSGAAA
nr:GNAT family N-acetyltransferase [Herbaspirillum sp. B39]